MEGYLSHAKHNKNFLDCLDEQFNDKFFDWKITALFYESLHLLKALAAKRAINIGETHTDIEKNCNPDRHDPEMPINRRAWQTYKDLYQYSRTARYEGIFKFETFLKVMERDYHFALLKSDSFKSYIKAQGIDVEYAMQPPGK